MEGHGASSPESLLVCLAAHTRSSSDVTGQSGQCFSVLEQFRECFRFDNLVPWTVWMYSSNPSNRAVRTFDFERAQISLTVLFQDR
jgi:hypothetical protein